MTLPVALAGLGGLVLYLALGFGRWSHGDAGSYDIGIFAQAAKGWADGLGPWAPIKRGNLFADHFSPITVLFGLGWGLWPDPRSLIVVQSLTLALTVALLTWFARVHAGLRGVRGSFFVVAVTLGLPFVSAAGFEVHEVSLGAPAVVGLACAVWLRRFRVALACSGVVVLVKEDLGLLVCAAGLAWWLLWRERSRAAWLATSGAVGVVVANLVIAAHRSGAVASPYAGQLLRALDVLELARWLPLVVFVAAAGGYVRHPLAWLAVPTLAWRMLSDNPHYWHPDYHYDVPTGAVAFVLLALALGGAGRWRRGAAVTLSAAVAVLGAVRVATDRPWSEGFREPPVQVATEHLSAHIPENAKVSTDQPTGPYLVRTHEVVALGDTTPTARWVVLSPSHSDFSGSACEKAGWVADARARGQVVIADGPVVVIDRGRDDPGPPPPVTCL